MLIKGLSGRAVLLVFFVFALHTANKVGDVATGQRSCVCSYDGFGYYMYNAALFGEGTLYMSPEWAQGLQDTYCNGTTAYQLVKQNYPNYLDVYHMGLAFLELPAYLISDVFARVLGYPTNGFSAPYHIGFLLNALLFIFLGLLYLRKLLLLYFNESITAILILIGYGATNVYITFTHQADLPHLHLFFLNAAFLYHLIVFTRTRRRRSVVYAAVLFGLTVAIRPTQAMFGIIPFILLYKEFHFTKRFWKNLLLFPLASLAWNVPQMLYWLIVGGKLLIPNLHLEEIVLTDPNLPDFLFSFRKGWLLYTPVFLLLIPGFVALFRKERSLFTTLITATLLYIYIMSAWECWWYAASFSSRVMVDIYPFLLPVIGFGLLSLEKTWAKIVLGGFVLLCAILSWVQSIQFDRTILNSERMTAQHYWYIFGHLQMPELTDIHLLIDRSDIDWVNRNYPRDQYDVRTNTIYTLPRSMRSLPGEDLTIGRLNLLELIETDETQFDVRIVVRTSDSTQSSLLRMETVSPYNCYSWDQLEVSRGLSQHDFTELHLRFNLPDIRHAKDQMQMYLDNDAPVSVEIREMEITATSLIRK